MQSDHFLTTFAGAEANVAVSVANFGHRADFVSALPSENPLAEHALRSLAFWLVGTRAVVRRPGRMGTYFLESAGGIRQASVLYDRAHSLFAKCDPSLYDWANVLEGADFLHLTGVTPALGPKPERAMRDAIECAEKLGVPICFDVNYRRALWNINSARAVLPVLASRARVLVASMYQIEELFGIPTPSFNESSLATAVESLAKSSGALRVVLTCRKVASSHIECRRAAVWDNGITAITSAREYPVLEPLGGGDAFCGALLARLMEGASLEEASVFGDAAAALKYGIFGDFNKVSRQEVFTFLESGPGTVGR